MEENKDDLANEEAAVETEELSSPEAMTGVLMEPGDTYERMSLSPQKNYWILPVIILVVVNIIATVILYSNVELLNSMMDKEIAKMEEKVKSGEMTQEQFTQAKKFMEPDSIFFKAIAYAGSIIGPFIILLIYALIILSC